ncbi:MFS general substrate transporter [Hygrophoropsis aurantiaca]|uniref:MFS general substrate transporter n=1 Tax=Hygrophoropsis aurantiaca TaxID=72124 RepID=A0ACB8AH39_9AGAM|nr:MFS general substrate transporter [Hygrophoropsis aurantiaca]
MSHNWSSRNHSVESTHSAHNSQFNDLVPPTSNGFIDEPTAEIIDELVSPHHEAEETLVSSEEEEDEGHLEEVAGWQKRPWWRRPSFVWLLVAMPMSSIGFSSTLAPRVELYTMLVCRIDRPEYISNSHFSDQYPYSALKPLVAHSNLSLPALENVIPASEHSDDLELHGVLIPAITNISLSKYEIVSGDTRKQCAADPVVQAATAKLAAVLTTTIGVLGCLTTGWWSSLSDRFGRTRIMTATSIGLLATDVVVIVTAFYVDSLPGGYWFLLVGMVLDGLFGGLSTGVAAMHAYLADCTTSADRSRIFSMTLGLMFAGVALGPIIGGLLVRTTGSALAVFYFAAGLHALFFIYVGLIVPESLTNARARGARARYQEAVDARRSETYSGTEWILSVLRGAVSFLSPLTILLPARVEVKGNPLKRSKRDWSLLCVAASYGFAMTDQGSITYKFQYAAGTFGWSSEIVSYFIALAGAGRAILLTLLLPLIIKLLKPIPAAPIQLPTDSDEIGHLNATAESTPVASKSKRESPPHPSAFDLRIARCSLFIELIAFVLVALASSGAVFTAASVLGSFGSGFAPAIQAFALELYLKRDGKGRNQTGRLFGAISVVQVLATQIISPSLFGYAYAKTVGTFPRTILFMTAFSIAISLTLLAFVRPPSGNDKVDVDPEEFIADLPNQDGMTPEVPIILITREDTLVDTEGDQETDGNGRKAV